VPPICGEWTTSLNGASANQPKAAAPCGVRKPTTAISEPKRWSQ
jgi:hypothetical protein